MSFSLYSIQHAPSCISDQTMLQLGKTKINIHSYIEVITAWHISTQDGQQTIPVTHAIAILCSSGSTTLYSFAGADSTKGDVFTDVSANFF